MPPPGHHGPPATHPSPGPPPPHMGHPGPRGVPPPFYNQPPMHPGAPDQRKYICVRIHYTLNKYCIFGQRFFVAMLATGGQGSLFKNRSALLQAL